MDDVIVCFNFLVALGNYRISVSTSDQISGVPGFRQVAIYNSAVVIAHLLNVQSTSSTAYEVALGVQWVFTNCNSGGQVAGKFHRGTLNQLCMLLLTREKRHRIGCCVRQRGPCGPVEWLLPLIARIMGRSLVQYVLDGA